jgi:hypothetical protein
MTYCWPWAHDWSKWQTFSHGLIVVNAGEKPPRPLGSFIEQKRECAKCGKIQLRESRT